MTDRLTNLYFEWLCQIVSDEHYTRGSTYRKLLKKLFETDFYYTEDAPMDVNRYEDGINIRYRFGQEKAIDKDVISSCIDNRPCSILEMMVALTLKCEESIMYDQSQGDQAPRWFWGMIDSLGLKPMDDSSYSRTYTDKVLERFLDRKYNPDGSGGLFTIDGCDKDLRSVEIWYQMCWYLNSIL